VGLPELERGASRVDGVDRLDVVPGGGRGSIQAGTVVGVTTSAAGSGLSELTTVIVVTGEISVVDRLAVVLTVSPWASG